MDMAKLVGAVVVGALAALGGVLIAMHHPRASSHARIDRTASIVHRVPSGPSGAEVAALFGGRVTRLPVALRHRAHRRHHGAHKALAAAGQHSSATTQSAPSQSTPTDTYTAPVYTAPVDTQTTHYTAPVTVQRATTSHTTTHHKSQPQSGTTTIGGPG